ncbi:MAG TPA: NADPH:quinone reductase [Ideonella sp.]|uniref:NADPH:quinone reductase n=1 Tax=Ideonella sp. TaxID=1929293 RepID=UPI002E31DE04|nr:NADPH:quinone reductase [Ideonella sp.]HEX5682833.1 NADPH:quinone reductase [Ideonella sp.]
MRAAVYRAKGRAVDVLSVDELPKPQPGPGEVLVRVVFSGVNPSDVKSRAGLGGAPMDYPFVVPHSDGAGEIVAVGEGVAPRRVGERVWLFNGQWGRAMGTAAEFVALPARQAVTLPEGVTLEVGASIGIPLLTAVHAVLSLGTLLNKTVMVPGAAGAVGAYVTQLVALAGGRPIAVVSSDEKAALARSLGAVAAVNYKTADLAAEVRALTQGEGADAVVEVDVAGNARHYAQALRFGGQAVIYGSNAPTIELPFRPLISRFIKLYFFIVYLLPEAALREAIDTATGLLQRGALRHPELATYPLADIARAHERVEAGANAKVLVAL